MKNKIKSIISVLTFLIMSICIAKPAYSQQIEVVPIATAHTVNQNKTFNTISFQDLTLGIVPTVYLKNGLIENPMNSTSPIRLIVDMASIQLLNESQLLFDEVKLIVFKLKSNEELITLKKIISFNHFPQLELIYFSCSFNLCGGNGTEECEIQTLENSMNPISKAGLSAFYTSSIEQ